MASKSAVTIAHAHIDDILEAYYEKYVIVHDQLTKTNRGIAEDFLSNFTKFVHKTYGLNVAYFTQGSAFEGIKVGPPDEFDFLLVILNAQTFGPLSGEILTDYSGMKSRNPGALAPYTPIKLGAQELKNPAYSKLQAIWPNTKEACFSAQACVRFFQTCINEYVKLCQTKQYEDGVNYRIKGVNKVKPPSIGNPALTTLVNKDDKTWISIDITLAAVLGTTYYIAKWKTNESLSDDERYKMLWLTSYSEQEKDEINKRRTDNQKKNYRISKGLLRGQVPNSFILKTIFLREIFSREIQQRTPYNFLRYMMHELKGGYGAEIERRGLTAECSVRQAGELLLFRFNKDYNLLANYGDQEIIDHYKRFVSLNDQKEPEALLSKLLTQTEINALKQMIGCPYNLPIGEI